MPSSRRGRPAARPRRRSAARSRPPRSPRRRCARGARSPAGSPAVRRTAFFTVRTTSSGCSSPNCHSRELPVSSPGGAGVGHVVVAAAGGVQLGEHAAQRRRPQPADRLGGELELALGAVEEALPLQLALELAQRGDVVDGGSAERPLQQLLVDVGQRGPGVALGELVGQRLEVGQLGDRAWWRRPCRAAARRRAPARAGPTAGPGGPGAARPAGGPSRWPAPCPAWLRPSGRPAPPAGRGRGRPSSAPARPPGGPASRSARRSTAGRRGRTRRACP